MTPKQNPNDGSSEVTPSNKQSSLGQFDGELSDHVERFRSNEWLDEPVKVALDVSATNFACGDEERQWVTSTIACQNAPLILAVESVRNLSGLDDIVQGLLQRTQRHVEIDVVVAGKSFRDPAVIATLDELGLNYLISGSAGTQTPDNSGSGEENDTLQPPGE
jgi:hypothetical protein